MAKRHNVNTGFQRFKLPLLVSYPRSGTNWIRYVIEYCTNQPTPGENRLIRGNNLMYVTLNGGFAIDRAHKGFAVMPAYPKVLFILRNYKECLIRQFKSKWKEYETIEAFLTAKDLHTPPLWYIENLKAFEDYQSPKKLLYFEEIVEHPLTFLNEIGSFLSLNPMKIKEIKENLPTHQNKSVSLYTKRGKKSFTTKSNSTSHHANDLSKSQQIEMDEFYKRNYPVLTEKYLRRYLED